MVVASSASSVCVSNRLFAPQQMRSQAAQINLQGLPREDRKDLDTERQQGEHMSTNLTSRMQRPRQPSPESILWRGPRHQEPCAGSPLHLPARFGVTEVLLASSTFSVGAQCWCRFIDIWMTSRAIESVE